MSKKFLLILPIFAILFAVFSLFSTPKVSAAISCTTAGTNNYCGTNNTSPTGGYPYYSTYSARNSCTNGSLSGTSCGSGSYCVLSGSNIASCSQGCVERGYTCASSCSSANIIPSGTNGYACPSGGTCCASAAPPPPPPPPACQVGPVTCSSSNAGAFSYYDSSCVLHSGNCADGYHCVTGTQSASGLSCVANTNPPPPQTRYACSNNTCIQSATGAYTTGNCNNACTPPSAKPATPVIIDTTSYCSVNVSKMNFTWYGVPGATYYNLTWNNPNGSISNLSSAAACPTGNCSYTPNVSFNQNVLIVWSVNACNSSGCSSSSGGFTQSKICAVNPPPPPPSNNYVLPPPNDGIYGRGSVGTCKGWLVRIWTNSPEGGYYADVCGDVDDLSQAQWDYQYPDYSVGTPPITGYDTFNDKISSYWVIQVPSSGRSNSGLMTIYENSKAQGGGSNLPIVVSAGSHKDYVQGDFWNDKISRITFSP